MRAPLPTYMPRRAPQTEDVVVRGIRHRVTRWGPRDVDPILLLHGFQDCGSTFQFLVDCLPQHWALVAPDLRGFGGSEPRSDSYWFPDYLADVDALLAHYAPSGAPGRIIGHSMGGNIAMLHAGVRPDRWRWAVSLEGFGLPRTKPGDAPGRYLQWLDQVRAGPKPRSRYADSDVLARKLLQRDPLLGPERASFIARAWTRPGAADGVETATDPWHRFANPVLYRREEAEACWLQIRAPLLLLLASESEYLTRIERDDDVASMRRCVPHLRGVMLQGIGHMMHHQDPAAVAHAIVEFVRGVEEGA